MLASLTTTLSLLAFAGASPLKLSSRELSRSDAYHLQVQLREPTKDLDPPVADTFIGTIHVGAGQNIAVVGGRTSPDGTPFYTNGTGSDSNVLNDLGTSFPWGLIVQDEGSSDATYPGEHDVQINVGGGTPGIGLEASGDSVRLGGLASGYYAACNRFIGYARANLTVVRYVYEGEALHDGCVGINFVPLCATLDDLPAGSEWTHDFVQEVDCVVPAAKRL